MEIRFGEVEKSVVRAMIGARILPPLRRHAKVGPALRGPASELRDLTLTAAADWALQVTLGLFGGASGKIERPQRDYSTNALTCGS